ncbi:MAG: glycosyltransferase family protein [Planctomycetes bacterium]|nr:glycosyltransferase family protein [Planctomycetota bacterium]
MKRVVAIIQARMGSARLPGKVLSMIGGRPMLWHIVQRVRAVHGVADVVVASSDTVPDEPIREFGRRFGVDVFSGSLNDVLDRFYHAARGYQADIVLRVTGDCPLFDPKIVSQMLQRFLNDGTLDHIGVATGAGVANCSDIGRYPDGLDAELTSIGTLEIAWREATQPVDREHVTPFVWKQPQRFRVATFYSPVDYSQLRWTVDNQEDLEVVRAIYAALYKPERHFLMQDVLDFLATHPEVSHWNQQFIGREGYQQFWKDRSVPCQQSLNAQHVA